MLNQSRVPSVGAKIMQQLLQPFVNLWNYVGYNYGMPGQIFFVASFVLLALAVFTWVGNRK
jgi:hypothetical protein